MKEPLTELPVSLFSALQADVFLILNTIDHESAAPSVNAISWVYARDTRTIRFSVDARSRIILNIHHHAHVSFTYIAEGTVYAVYGEAKVIADELAEVPFKLACVDVSITSIREAMFYGAKITNQIEYEKTYDKRAAEKLDNQVFDAMKKA